MAAIRSIDAAEAFRDLPGLALLESARPGRNARWTYLTADPVAVLESPAAGRDPFAVARRLVARLDPSRPELPDAPPFLGGLVGFLGYDLGHALERLPSLAVDDQGFEDIDPIRSFYAAVSLMMNTGQSFNPAQRMTREEALRSYTINGAYAGFQENAIGSIKAGKYADLVVLSKDILTIPEEEIPSAAVVYTIVGGKIRYKR